MHSSRSAEAALTVGVLAIVALLPSTRADACGPDFPLRLLEDRRATTLGLVEGSFDWEAAHLVVPRHPYAVVEGVEPKDARSAGSARERALYDEGAALWNHGESLRVTPPTDADAAALDPTTPWKALLALPRPERQVRSTWAAYMLGRVTGDPRWFQRTRGLVDDGYDDALGLAVASLGEEARLRLDHDDLTGAAHLYAEQAALGSGSGRSSLLVVARMLLKSDAPGDVARLTRALRDPLVQRLVGGYLFSRSVELDEQKIARTLRAAGGIAHLDGADRWAAAAYRAGRYDLATTLTARSTDTALALWVRAKLALRAGRVDEGRALLARASADFPAGETWSTLYTYEGTPSGIEDVAPHRRVDGERAVLALNHGEYTVALTEFLTGGETYWLDAAYVAERVLTTDALLTYVQMLPDHGAHVDAPHQKLRGLLARRLMREHRFTEALPFFDDPAAKDAARRFGDAYLHGEERPGTLDLARARFDAAVLLRRHGLEIVGTELAPDWAVWGGDLEESDVAAGAVTADERARAAKTSVAPRFHYRREAALRAAHAADDLPRHSQAFAAVLCTGASWVIDRDPSTSDALWSRYTREGAMVDFAGTFGRACPAADFDAARAPPPPPPVKKPLVHKRIILRDVGLAFAALLFFSALSRALARKRALPETDGVP